MTSRYHSELRYQLDMADIKLSDAMKWGGRFACPEDRHAIKDAMAWRHMLIVELNRVQNEEREPSLENIITSIRLDVEEHTPETLAANLLSGDDDAAPET